MSYLDVGKFRLVGFDKVAAVKLAGSDDLSDMMEKLYGQEGLKEAGNNLKEAMNKNPSIIQRLENKLDSQEGLKEDLLEMAQNDPARFSTLVSGISQNPNDLDGVLNSALNKATDQALVQDNPEADVEAAEVVAEASASSPSEKPEMKLTRRGYMPVRSTEKPAEQKDVPEPVSVVVAAGASASGQEEVSLSAEEQTMSAVGDIMVELHGKPGGEELFDKINNDPTLKAAIGNTLAGPDADPEHALKIMQELKERVDANPHYMEKLNDMMDKGGRPGMMKQFAETMANDPEKAFDQLDQYMVMQDGMNMIEGLFDSFGMGGLFNQIMEFMGPLLAMFGGFQNVFGGDKDVKTQKSDKNANSMAEDAKNQMNGNGNVVEHDKDTGKPVPPKTTITQDDVAVKAEPVEPGHRGTRPSLGLDQG